MPLTDRSFVYIYIRTTFNCNNNQPDPITTTINLSAMKKILSLFAVHVMLMPAILSGQIITNPDSISVYLNQAVLVDVLANDYEVSNDSIYVDNASGWPVISNRYVVVELGNNYLGVTGRVDTITYSVRQANGPAVNTGELYVTLINESFSVLDVNNLSARFTAFGSHFWDLAGKSEFYAPKWTTKTPIFSKSLWIGGQNSTGGLHLAAEQYRINGQDFWAGPVSLVYDPVYDQSWMRVWKLTRDEVNHHIANFNSTGYTPIRDIEEWPAHGDTLNGQAWNLAPFHDANNNGIYEPMLGDYPLIRGDMSLFFIFNDARDVHTESGGTPLGIEIHGMAYAFDMPPDSVLHNTIFLHYTIINRSANQYTNCWAGIFADIDIGFAYDDYLACDVENGGFIGYNGVAVDGSGQSHAYGAFPPAMGIQILGGPFIEPDGLDNPKTDSLGNPLCDVSLNGANFGNGIADDERLGLSKFMALPQINHGAMPGTPAEYFNYLQGFWPDNTQLLYGGNGHLTSAAYGPACSFMFPMDSDSCNFGTGGIAPAGPKYWSESSAGNQPFDRKAIGSSGPFTFNPGDTHQLDIAFLVLFDSLTNQPVTKIPDGFSYIKDLFLSNPAMFDVKTSVKEVYVPARKNIRLYPNPATGLVNVSGLNSSNQSAYRIYGVSGNLIASGVFGSNNSVDVSNLHPGLYILNVLTDDGAHGLKFIKQ